MARRFLLYRDLKAKGVKYSQSQITRLRKLPADDPRKFPDPVEGLGRERPFIEDEIDAYLERQIALRDTADEAA